jgi:hypothetical protein
MSKMNLALKASDVNHLRRLLAYIRLDIGQAPEEMAETLRSIAPIIRDAQPEGVARLKDACDKSLAVPQYVRAAIKALEKTLVKSDGEILDVDSARTVQELEG